MKSSVFPWRLLSILAVFHLISLCACGARAADALGLQLIRQAVFAEPLLPASESVPSDQETQPVINLLESLRSPNAPRDPVELLEAFVRGNPTLVWTPSLRSHLASHYRKRGRFTLALDHWAAAWELVRRADRGCAKQVADAVIAHWTELLAALGSAEELAGLLTEVNGRELDGGPHQQRLNAVREAYGRLAGQPEESFRCGPQALLELAQALGTTEDTLVMLRGTKAGRDGTTLKDLQDLAAQHHLALVAVELPPESSLPLPAVIHYRVGHFATVLEYHGKRYRVADPAFRTPRWIREDDLHAEITGPCLVPSAALPKDARVLSPEEARAMRGRGYPNSIKDVDDAYVDMSSAPGVPTWRVSEPYINLWTQANIINYPLPNGANQVLDLAFKQRNTRSAAGAFTFGPAWECSWLSYIDYDVYETTEPPDPGWEFVGEETFLPLGGMRVYPDDAVEYFSQATLSRSGGGSSPIFEFELTFSDRYQSAV